MTAELAIARLIADFQLTEARLRHALGHDAPPQHTAELLQLCAEKMDAIESHVPASPGALRELTHFFLSRASRMAPGQAVGRDLDLALDLLNRYAGAWPELAAQRPPETAEVAARREATACCMGATLAHYVSNAQGWVVAADRQHRVLAASQAAARACRSSRGQLVAGPLAPLLGEAAYAGRDRAQLDRCLAGAVVEYAIEPGPAPGDRPMRIQMRPVMDEAGAACCALIHLDPLPERLEVLPADHSIAGTTRSGGR